ncbi:MAG: biopolymer transporter ExbD [Planctomycetaceae bacterium]|nr:biopolymer transporter ExbD [Planctomycetaceae bacterium]
MSERTGNSGIIKPRKRVDDSEMDITPMIDITFLLLSFFVVASKMQEQAPIPLPYAKHGEAIAAKDAVMINIEQDSPDSDAYFYLGRAVERGSGIVETDENLEEQIQEYVNRELQTNDKIRFIVIRAGHQTRMKNMKVAKQAANRGIPEGREITIHAAVNEGQ